MALDHERIFEILVREHELALLAFVRTCVYDRGAAEDLVQDTFLAAWNQLEEYDENTPFARWLRGVAKNKIPAYCRASATAAKHVQILDPDRITAIASEFNRLIPRRGDTIGDTLDALEECLAALPAADHEVVRMAYHRRQTCRVIANQLGHTVEAIKKRLQRARTQLRDCILGKLKTEAAHG